jgi:hypothetical protein
MVSWFWRTRALGAKSGFVDFQLYSVGPKAVIRKTGVICRTVLTETRGFEWTSPVTKQDYERADEVRAAVRGVREGRPSDEDPPISDVVQWTEPDSASLRRTTGDLTLKTFRYHFVYYIMPLQHALPPLVLHLHPKANEKAT